MNKRLEGIFNLALTPAAIFGELVSMAKENHEAFSELVGSHFEFVDSLLENFLESYEQIGTHITDSISAIIEGDDS